MLNQDKFNQDLINDLRSYIEGIKDINNQEFAINAFLIILKKFFIESHIKLKKTHEDDLKNFLDAIKENQENQDQKNQFTNTKIIITLTTLVVLAGLSYMVYIFKIEPAIKRKTIKTQFYSKHKFI
jgi:hypothetical protein